MRQRLTNLGWIGFHRAIIDYNLNIATEVGSTMQLDADEDGSDALVSHMCDETHVVTVDALAVLFGFDVGASVARDLSKEDMNSFWLRLLQVEEHKPGNIWRPAIQLSFRWLVAHTQGKVDFGNITDKDMRWLYNAIVCPTNCNPIHSVVRNWFDKRSKASGRMAFAGYV